MLSLKCVGTFETKGSLLDKKNKEIGFSIIIQAIFNNYNNKTLLYITKIKKKKNY